MVSSMQCCWSWTGCLVALSVSGLHLMLLCGTPVPACHVVECLLSIRLPPHHRLMCVFTGVWSIIFWFHAGTGQVSGGQFCFPTLGMRFMPLECTVIVLAAGAVVHGTAPIVANKGVQRVGSSHFLRVPDIQHLGALEVGHGSRAAVVTSQKRTLEQKSAAEHCRAKLQKLGKEKHASKMAVIQNGFSKGACSVNQTQVLDGLMFWEDWSVHPQPYSPGRPWTAINLPD